MIFRYHIYIVWLRGQLLVLLPKEGKKVWRYSLNIKSDRWNQFMQNRGLGYYQIVIMYLFVAISIVGMVILGIVSANEPDFGLLPYTCVGALILILMGSVAGVNHFQIHSDFDRVIRKIEFQTRDKHDPVR